jgi:hypothetical protein
MLDLASTLSQVPGIAGESRKGAPLTRPRYQKGSLKAIGKNCWEIRWREDLMNADGSVQRVRRKETLRGKTKAQALEILDAHLSEVKTQQRQPGVTMPLAKFVRTEWKPNASLRLRKSSMRIYNFNLDQHILPAFGEIPLLDLNRAHIESCLSGL